MDIKKEREAFESAMQELSGWQTKNDVNPVTGEYQYGVMQVMWSVWQKARAVPEKDVIIKKLSDQLYSQEMKTSAARTLCETACELLDDYAHQDAMVILNDLEQAMIEAQEQSHD